MSGLRDASGTAHALAGIAVRDGANALRTGTQVRFRDGGNVLRGAFSSLSATLSAANVFGKVNSGMDTTITTQKVTASAAGGATPYTYAWTRTDGGSDLWEIDSPTAAATTFRATTVEPGDTQQATFECAVTDSAERTVTTSEVTATATNIYAGGGGPLPVNNAPIP